MEHITAKLHDMTIDHFSNTDPMFQTKLDSGINGAKQEQWFYAVRIELSNIIPRNVIY